MKHELCHFGEERGRSKKKPRCCLKSCVLLKQNSLPSEPGNNSPLAALLRSCFVCSNFLPLLLFAVVEVFVADFGYGTFSTEMARDRAAEISNSGKLLEVPIPRPVAPNCPVAPSRPMVALPTRSVTAVRNRAATRRKNSPTTARRASFERWRLPVPWRSSVASSGRPAPSPWAAAERAMTNQEQVNW